MGVDGFAPRRVSLGGVAVSIGWLAASLGITLVIRSSPPAGRPGACSRSEELVGPTLSDNREAKELRGRAPVGRPNVC
jgi:hypothetical protein